MGLRQHKRFQAPAWPEFLALALAALCAGVLLAWGKNRVEPNWSKADGQVIAAQTQLTHYNAAALYDKVTISYEYFVDGIRYTGSWEGLWPELGSPNALTHDELPKLCVQGYPLTIFYEPTNPEKHVLHYAESSLEKIQGEVAFALFIAVLFYFLKVYPWLKKR